LNNEQMNDLCLSLMRADTEEEVISLLKDVGYWDDATFGGSLEIETPITTP
jgi:hypothetical protein